VSVSAATLFPAPTSSTASTAFEADPETKAVVMIGEIGGSEEERAAEYIKAHMTKPVVRHRWRHRSSRTQDGPRRCHHLWLEGNGAGRRPATH
jgi:hypothetical protein